MQNKINQAALVRKADQLSESAEQQGLADLVGKIGLARDALQDAVRPGDNPGHNEHVLDHYENDLLEYERILRDYTPN